MKSKFVERFSKKEQPEPQPKIIERIIEKEPKVIKEAPDYDNIPPEIIENLIEKRHATAREHRHVKYREKKKLTANIA